MDFIEIERMEILKEKWEECFSDVIPRGKYEVVKISQDCNGTIIELASGNNLLTINFNFVDALRVCDEGRRIVTYNEIIDIQKYRENFYGNPLYQVENSEFFEWLSFESCGFCTDVQHYAIITINHIIDVITAEIPEIQISDLC